MKGMYSLLIRRIFSSRQQRKRDPGAGWVALFFVSPPISVTLINSHETLATIFATTKQLRMAQYGSEGNPLPAGAFPLLLSGDCLLLLSGDCLFLLSCACPLFLSGYCPFSCQVTASFSSQVTAPFSCHVPAPFSSQVTAPFSYQVSEWECQVGHFW